MVGPDEQAASVPHFLSDAEFLPNTYGLPVAVEGKHPEYIVDQVEKALSKNEDTGCVAFVSRSEKEGMRFLASKIIGRLTAAP